MAKAKKKEMRAQERLGTQEVLKKSRKMRLADALRTLADRLEGIHQAASVSGDLGIISGDDIPHIAIQEVEILAELGRRANAEIADRTTTLG